MFPSGRVRYPTSNRFKLDAAAVFARQARKRHEDQKPVVLQMIQQADRTPNPRIKESRLKQATNIAFKNMRRFSPLGSLGTFARVVGWKT